MRNRIPLRSIPVPATIDVAVLVRGRVVETLRGKASEIAESGGRFEAHGNLDEFGRFHERGGYYNTTPDYAAAGYGKGDVDDVVRELRQFGIRVAYEDVDALLGQLVRTDVLDDAELTICLDDRAITVRLDIEMAAPPLPEPTTVRVRNFHLVQHRSDLYVVRPVVAAGFTRTHVVVRHGGVCLCTCATVGCEHVAIVQEFLGKADRLPNLAALRLSDTEHAILVRAILALLAPYGPFRTPREKRERGNQPRSVPQRALQLLLRALFGPSYRSHPDALRLAKIGIIDEPAGSTTTDRYRGEPDVARLLARIRDVATRGLRARGIAVISLLAESDRGDMIAADIVQALRLDARLADLAQPLETENAS